ncbi:MAG TPA: hypothetical protein VMJ10_15295 [Kofleriaceae bacterium]|nr:hypothetical protein [Kofleriaceae bacterium]
MVVHRAAVVLLALAATARAEPADLVARPIVLAPGQLEAALVAEIDLASGEVGTPTSLAPDAWFGATGRLTVGIVNSHSSIDRYDPGASFCLSTLVLACDHAYTGSGLDARYLVLDGPLAIAPRARFLVRDIDPWKPAFTAGALVRWTRGRFAITGDPYVQLGLANVELGNRAQLFVPLAFGVQPLPHWLVTLRTGYDSELDVWSDGYHVPAWLGVTFAALAQLDVGAAVGFASVLGPQASGKERQVFVTIDWSTQTRR